MKTYLVTLQLVLGDYQKMSKTLIVADTKENAGIMALALECHGDAKFDENNPTLKVYDLGGEFGYIVDSIEEVSHGHLDVLELYYGNPFVYSEADIAECMA